MPNVNPRVGYRTLALALITAGGPARGITAFFQWVQATYEEHLAELRHLRVERDHVVAKLVQKVRMKRDTHGHFLPVKPLKHELLRINNKLAAR